MSALIGTGSTDRIETKFTAHGTLRSYCIWTYRTGEGGGNLGRMFDKRQGGAESELLYNSLASTAYFFQRDATVNGAWSVARPSANAWHHVAVTYDSSSLANNPKIYIDGVSLSFASSTSPTVALINNTDAYVLGNRGAGATANRNWAGALAHFCIHDCILSPGEIKDAMRYGFTPRGLRAYYPLTGLQPELDLAYTERLPGDAGLLMATTVKPGRTDCPVIPRPASLVA